MISRYGGSHLRIILESSFRARFLVAKWRYIIDSADRRDYVRYVVPSEREVVDLAAYSFRLEKDSA